MLQRGEDRCQGNMDDSASQSMRAANDLGYAATVLKGKGHTVFLKDFQTEGLSEEDLIKEFRSFNPDVIFTSVTNSSIMNDIECVKRLHRLNKDLVIILKGALFFDPEDFLLEELDLDDVDYLIGGESDFIIADLVDSHFNDLSKLADIGGIVYKKEGQWTKTDFTKWETDLDSLAFPDRSLMNNGLYLRPDNNEPIATISTSRGCSAKCIYCLTPRISGTEIRVRSPQNIFEELKECYFKHNIRNFFFKSDTFTMDRTWVKELCDYIVNSDLHGKISWVANSRVNPLEQATLHYMKEAGCWLIAFGFESGSEESLQKMKKGATVADNLRAAKFSKNAGLKVLGFFLIGLPWENWSHLRDTRKLMFDMDPDFAELHLATPYFGTDLYKLALKEGVLTDKKTVLGKDYYTPGMGTKYLNTDELLKFKKQTMLKFYLRPSYIGKKTIDACLHNPKALSNYLKYGTRLIKNNLFNGYKSSNEPVAK